MINIDIYMDILRKILLIITFIFVSCAQVIKDDNGENSNDDSNDETNPDDNPVTEVTCGYEVYENITLTEDLVCPPEGHSPLRILGTNLTVDLGGYKIVNSNPAGGIYGILVEPGANNITIKNGSIEDFLVAIDINTANNIKVENIKIVNTVKPLAESYMGINIAGSYDVNINDCQFQFPHEFGLGAIMSYESWVAIKRIEVIGGSLGINFNFFGNCNPGSSWQNNGGIISECKFTDIGGACILINCSRNLDINNNEFSNCDNAILAGGPKFGSIENLVVDSNYIHDVYRGIVFAGITKSTISNNTIQNNSIGISLEKNIGWWNDEAFYSIENIISNNNVTGCDPDLYHDAGSIGNNWINNTCQIKDGSEIPECTG